MTLLAIYSIYCNDCGTFERIPGHDAESVSEIVAHVRHLGWTTSRRGKQARCPDCQVKAAAMKEPDWVIPPMRLNELERICRESQEGTAVQAGGGQTGTGRPA